MLKTKHSYTLGQTGTGKTTLIYNNIFKNIENGEGVCFIDFYDTNGSEIQGMLDKAPAEKKKEILILDVFKPEEDFKYEDFINYFSDEKVLIIKIPLGHFGLEKGKFLANLIVQKIYLEILAEENKNTKTRFIYLDEISRHNLDNFEKIIPVFSEHNISVNISHQYLGQTYGNFQKIKDYFSVWNIFRNVIGEDLLEISSLTDNQNFKEDIESLKNYEYISFNKESGVYNKNTTQNYSNI
jgi:hypothetical protein